LGLFKIKVLLGVYTNGLFLPNKLAHLHILLFYSFLKFIYFVLSFAYLGLLCMQLCLKLSNLLFKTNYFALITVWLFLDLCNRFLQIFNLNSISSCLLLDVRIVVTLIGIDLSFQIDYFSNEPLYFK
jgi:hypothetical protein